MFSQTLQSHGGPREKPCYLDVRKRVGWELSHSSLGWMGAGGMGVEEKVRSTVPRMSGWAWAITTTLMALTRCLKKSLIYFCIWLSQVSGAVHGIFVAGHGLLLRLSCLAPCGFLVPWPEIEPASPTLQGRFLTTGSPGKVKVKVAQSCLTLWTVQSMEFSRPEYWSG